MNFVLVKISSYWYLHLSDQISHAGNINNESHRKSSPNVNILMQDIQCTPLHTPRSRSIMLGSRCTGRIRSSVSVWRPHSALLWHNYMHKFTNYHVTMTSPGRLQIKLLTVIYNHGRYMMPAFIKLVSHGITLLDIYFAAVGKKLSSHYNISAICYLCPI